MTATHYKRIIPTLLMIVTKTRHIAVQDLTRDKDPNDSQGVCVGQ